MGKRFKGKLCAYCATAEATTDDHIFAREFFTGADRRNLPKAPACAECNNAKSVLEHYLTAVLPFAGRHPQAAENLLRGVPGRLAKNARLNRELRGSMKPAWMRVNQGLYQPARILDFDGSKLEAWLRLVARGLLWHHWNTYLRLGDEASVMFLPDSGSAILHGLISTLRPAREVTENLGNGTVCYNGLQAADPPQLTIWTIRMYGGLVVSDTGTAGTDGEVPSCSVWWVITGPQELSERIARMR